MRGERKICRRVLALKEKSLLRNGTKSKYCLKKFIPIFQEQSPTSGRRVPLQAMSPISASNSREEQFYALFPVGPTERPVAEKKAVFVGVAIPPANYSKAQINKIVEAIDAFYSPTFGGRRHNDFRNVVSRVARGKPWGTMTGDLHMS